MRIDHQRALRRKAPAGNRRGRSPRRDRRYRPGGAAAKAVVLKSNRVGREPIFTFMATNLSDWRHGPGVARSPYLFPGPPRTVHCVRRKNDVAPAIARRPDHSTRRFLGWVRRAARLGWPKKICWRLEPCRVRRGIIEQARERPFAGRPFPPVDGQTGSEPPPATRPRYFGRSKR